MSYLLESVLGSLVDQGQPSMCVFTLFNYVVCFKLYFSLFLQVAFSSLEREKQHKNPQISKACSPLVSYIVPPQADRKLYHASSNHLDGTEGKSKIILK